MFVDLADGRAVQRDSLLGQVHGLTATTRVVEFNDLAALEAALALGDVACVLAEPVMTNIGMVLPEPGFWERAINIIRRHGSKLVMDETHTLSSGPGGYARAHGVKAGAVSVGKALGGGMPCAAHGFSAAQAEAAKRAAPPGHFGIGTTLTANLLAMAAMRAALTELMTPAIFATLHARCTRLAAGLRAVIGRHCLPWCVTQVGARCEFQPIATPPRNGSEAASAMGPPSPLLSATAARLVGSPIKGPAINSTIIDRADPLWPPIGSKAPASAWAGSSVGSPAASMAQPGGSALAARPISSISPRATALVAKSKTKGRWPALDQPKAIGLVPIRRPVAATRCDDALAHREGPARQTGVDDGIEVVPQCRVVIAVRQRERGDAVVLRRVDERRNARGVGRRREAVVAIHAQEAASHALEPRLGCGADPAAAQAADIPDQPVQAMRAALRRFRRGHGPRDGAGLVLRQAVGPQDAHREGLDLGDAHHRAGRRRHDAGPTGSRRQVCPAPPGAAICQARGRPTRS